MCKEPNKLPDGSVVVCRKCEQCVRNRINDWVGRNIAESKETDRFFAVTLTYGRDKLNQIDHPRAFVLTYSDVQKYIKLLRRHGYDVRYFVTGEYGTKKGRAHWHLILYFKGGYPSYESRKNFMHEEDSVKFWPHGWSYWDDNADISAVRYACKYLLKTEGNEGQNSERPRMSKKPPLGYRFFQKRAEQYVKDGLAPQDLEYSFPDVRFHKKDGSRETVKFWLRDRSAELFLDHFIMKWKQTYPNRDIPRSELIELYIKYGQVVKDEQRLLTRREFASGERYPLRPWPTSAEIRLAIEEADRLEKGRQRAKHQAQIQWWYQQRIREASNAKEKEAREDDYEQYKHARDADEFEGIAAFICKKYKISREEFDAQQAQYEYERQAAQDRKSKPDW